MSDREREDALQERVHLGLRELSGTERAPDLLEAVLASVAESDGRAVDPPGRPRRAAVLPIAAVLLLGAGVTIAVAVSSGNRPGEPAAEPGSVAPHQDPFDFEALPALLVANVAHAENLDERARRVIVVNPTDEVFEALSVHGRLLCVESGVGMDVGTVSDAALRHIAKLTGLRALRLKLAENVTDEDLRVLAGLPLLSHLEIQGSALTGRDLEELARFPSLQALVLRGPDIENGGLAFLERLPRLHSLDIAGHFGLTAEDLQPLRHLTELRELNLGGVNGRSPMSSRLPTADEADGVGTNDAVLVHCAGMTELRRLDLSGLQSVTDTGIAALAELEHLAWLDVTNCHGVTGDGFARLPASLEVLYAHGTGIDGRALGRFGKLRECKLDWCVELRDADLEALAVARDLEVLDLTYTKGMTAAAARHLRAFSKLRELTLFGAPWLRDEHLETVGGMSELRRLSIGGLLPLTDAGLARLRELRLEHLDLRGNKHVTADGLEHLRSSPFRTIWLPRRLREAAEALWPEAEKAFS